MYYYYFIFLIIIIIIIIIIIFFFGGGGRFWAVDIFGEMLQYKCSGNLETWYKAISFI